MTPPFPPPIPDVPEYRPLTVREFTRLAGDGAFAGEQVELIQGVIVPIPVEDPVHVACVAASVAALRRCYPEPERVRLNARLTVSDHSAPVVDCLVCKGSPPPAELGAVEVLVAVEVTDASRRLDLGSKARLYATAAIPNYLVIDAGKAQVHAFASPVDGLYTRHDIQGRGAEVALPDATVVLAANDLFPTVPAA